MAIGSYGSVRGSDVGVDDITMYYNYTPNRETLNNDIFKLSASELLTSCTLPAEDAIANYSENILEGLYNLALPSSTFNQLGIYTIYIKPKTIPIQITDCSVLSSLPSVRGIVININDLPAESTKLGANDALQGYRVEYINSDGTKLRNVVRHVITSNKVVPVNENIGNTFVKSTRYRFDDQGSLLFLQLTPSSSSDVKSNSYPFMGNIGQTILLSNTNFSPVVVEVEMVKNTIDTVANAILGEEIKDVQSGIFTKFDEDRKITNQYDLYEIKSDTGNEPLYEVKEKRTNIDSTQTFDNVLSGL